MGQPRYEIRVYPSAARDLEDITNYLNRLSEQAALKYYDLIVAEIESLSTMPERCPRPRDLTLAAKGYRYLIVKDYLVFFTVSDGSVSIHRIVYGRRNYQSFL